MRTPSPRPAVPSLPLRETIAEVVQLYRDHWRLLIPLAILVLIPQSVATAAFGSYEINRIEDFGDVAALGMVPVTVAINLGGEALYSGIVAAVAVHWRAGVARPDPRLVAASLPFLTLIAADVLIAIGTAVGVVLLVVPGIAFATYTFIAPALIELRGLGVRAAFRESARLITGNFWRVLLIGFLFYKGGEVAANIAVIPFHGFLTEAAVHLAAEALLSPLQGAAVVILALRLLDLHGEEPPRPRH